nr:unnamed protein product [Callosobruchus chinensis]
MRAASPPTSCACGGGRRRRRGPLPPSSLRTCTIWGRECRRPRNNITTNRPRSVWLPPRSYGSSGTGRSRTSANWSRLRST